VRLCAQEDVGDHGPGTQYGQPLIDDRNSARQCLAGRVKLTVSPSARIFPALGVAALASILLIVDLPAPFSLTRAWTEPRLMLKLTSLTARTPP
jgi:hypothetical protein